jgi:hypothetical protein
VPWHVARLVTRLVVDYFASRRLVIDYFTSAACPGASARRAARHVARRAALRRLLRVMQAHRRLFRLRAATKVDFGFQIASQSRLRFLIRILKSALLASKVDFGRI